MLNPANIPIEIFEGVDFYCPMLMEYEDGTYPDTAGYTSTFIVYPRGDRSLPPVVELTTENGGIEVGIQDGGDFGDYNIMLVMVAASTSILVPWGLGEYDWDLIDPFGHVQRIAHCTCVLTRGSDHG